MSYNFQHVKNNFGHDIRTLIYTNRRTMVIAYRWLAVVLYHRTPAIFSNDLLNPSVMALVRMHVCSTNLQREGKK